MKSVLDFMEILLTATAA